MKQLFETRVCGCRHPVLEWHPGVCMPKLPEHWRVFTVVTAAVANDGNVLIGDYDNSDATQNEVIAKVRGRGTAQGGMINIGTFVFFAFLSCACFFMMY